MGVYDVILGMDWLNTNRAIIECYARVVKLKPSSGKSVAYRETGVSTPKGNLCQVTQLSETKLKLKDIPIVRELPDVFQEDLADLPPPPPIEL